MQKLLKAGVVAVLLTLFGGTNVYAADAGPTVSDAHEMLGSLVGNGSLFANLSRDAIYTKYQGSGCSSTMRYDYKSKDDGYSMQIDWSAISSVEKDKDHPDYHLVEFNGFVPYTNSKETKKLDGGKFFLIDEVTSKRVEKAVNLLIKSCNKGSKFD